ncbi:hypothetical protein JCM10213_009133 [Rhodosporidiobolus nylandii]
MGRSPPLPKIYRPSAGTALGVALPEAPVPPTASSRLARERLADKPGPPAQTPVVPVWGPSKAARAPLLVGEAGTDKPAKEKRDLRRAEGPVGEHGDGDGVATDVNDESEGRAEAEQQGRIPGPDAVAVIEKKRETEMENLPGVVKADAKASQIYSINPYRFAKRGSLARLPPPPSSAPKKPRTRARQSRATYVRPEGYGQAYAPRVEQRALVEEKVEPNKEATALDAGTREGGNKQPQEAATVRELFPSLATCAAPFVRAAALLATSLVAQAREGQKESVHGPANARKAAQDHDLPFDRPHAILDMLLRPAGSLRPRQRAEGPPSRKITIETEEKPVGSEAGQTEYGGRMPHPSTHPLSPPNLSTCANRTVAPLSSLGDDPAGCVPATAREILRERLLMRFGSAALKTYGSLPSSLPRPALLAVIARLRGGYVAQQLRRTRMQAESRASQSGGARGRQGGMVAAEARVGDHTEGVQRIEAWASLTFSTPS